MKSKDALKLFSLVVAGTLLLYHPGIVGSQSARPPAEVKLQGVDFTAVKDQLFGPAGLLNQNQAFELKAENVVFTQRQVQEFFSPPSSASAPPSGTDIATLVGRVQQLPGTEVKLQGVVETLGNAGTVNRVPFEAKIEAGEVKIKGLSLTQVQFDSLVSRLQGIAGTRELKIEALVNGLRVEAEFENEGGRLRTKVESKVESKGRAEERRHRGEEGTSTNLNNDRARDRGKDLDHSLRGRERAIQERERVERVERPERERVERGERIERADRPERVERAERPERVERVERPERIEKVERPERIERAERVERPEHRER